MTKNKTAGAGLEFSYYKCRKKGTTVWFCRAIEKGLEDSVLSGLENRGYEYKEIDKAEYDNILMKR